MSTTSVQKSLAFLRSEIKASALPMNERLPPVRILARQAHVSAAAMCTALGILRDEGLISIVKNRGAYLGPDPAAGRKKRDFPLWSGGQRWQRLKTQIENDIFSGYYTAGEPMPSLRDLAKSYSVSYKTLRKALEAIAREGVILPSKKTYRVPSLRKTHATLAFVSTAGASSAIDFGGYPHTEFLSALRREAEKSLINIANCVYQPEWDGTNFGNQIRTLREKHSLLGWVLWSSRLPEQKLLQMIHLLREESLPHDPNAPDKPLAVVNVTSESIPATQLRSESKNPTLQIFNVAGLIAGRQVGQYLLKSGHRRVAFLSYCHKQSWSQHRYRGLLQAFQSAGLGEGVLKFAIDEADDHLHTLPTPPEIAEYLRHTEDFLSTSARAGQEHYAAYALQQMQGSVDNYIHQLKMAERVEPILDAILREPGITACVAANDRMALLIRDHLIRNGIRVPKDISIVGFDDSKAATDNDMTSYSFAIADIARKVLSYVLDPRPRHFSRDDFVLECEGSLIERSSSGTARNVEIPVGTAGVFG